MKTKSCKQKPLIVQTKILTKLSRDKFVSWKSPHGLELYNGKVFSEVIDTKMWNNYKSNLQNLLGNINGSENTTTVLQCLQSFTKKSQHLRFLKILI